jgi:hypothetical protein
VLIQLTVPSETKTAATPDNSPRTRTLTDERSRWMIPVGCSRCRECTADATCRAQRNACCNGGRPVLRNDWNNVPPSTSGQTDGQ